MDLLQSESPEKPVIIADIQDNPGAGGTSDTTGILKALIEQSATHTVLGVMYDSEIASMAHRHRVGDSIHAQLGAKSGLVNQTPVDAEYKILALSDGRIPYTGEITSLYITHHGSGLARAN